MDQAVILSAVRTPIGKFQGGLAPLSAPQLGAKVVAEAVRRAGIEPKSVDEIIMGNVVQAGLGQNPARQAGLGGGLDVRVAAMTINKVCGSGLKAVGLAAQSVILGEAEIVVAGGMESMSNCPYLLPGRAHRLPVRQRGSRGLDGARRPVGRVQRFSHGHHGRAGRRKIRHHAAGAGPVRARKPPARRARAEILLHRIADCAHRNPAEKGRSRRHQV